MAKGTQRVESGDDLSSGTRPLLFVSYSRTDIDRARPVIDLLEAAGFDVWWDGKLEGGENYLQTTETALETSACVVAVSYTHLTLPTIYSV